jgi:DNA-binding MarR family transcriptional regulator
MTADRLKGLMSWDERCRAATPDCVVRVDNFFGWSLYGAPWLQPAAINGKSSSRPTRENKRKPLRCVATGCRQKYMVRRAGTGRPRELPSGSTLEAWDSFLRAHATLMRRLEVDLAQETGLGLADFDVLAQLARAGGELRMTDLATRALVSRSGMTRRVARLVAEGLVRRANADTDGRAVVVALTNAGLARLTETAPIHLRGVSELFVAQLDDQELAVLKNALDKVTVDCTFG